MCGIAGIWRFKLEVSNEEIIQFTDSMKHRGPDGSGYHVFNESNIALGHRRLAILDLSEMGKQPMQYFDTGFWITYNGEVYNFLEIREKLIEEGFKFQSNSDTEVILAAYLKWGSKCLDKFNGMFAFAIYDRLKNEIFIARDRFGVKPLHYIYIPGKLFAFASETLAFKYLHGYKRIINDQNLIYSIHSPGLLEPIGKTIFKDIYQLKAGHFAYVNPNCFKEDKWYDLTTNIKPINIAYNDQVEQFKNLFLDACKLRLRSDVSIASALSGGMDSSSVFCTIKHLAKQNLSDARLPKNWQKAFSISFPGTDLDEAKFVKMIQKECNAEVNIIENSYSNLIDDIRVTTKLFDSITSTPLVAVTDVYKAMRQQNIIVSLDGHAGDELLFGYRSSVYEALFEAHLNGDKNSREIAELYLAMTNETIDPMQITALEVEVERFSNKFKPGIKNKVKSILKVFFREKKEDFWIPESIKGHANRFLYKQFQYTELPYNLRDFDRAAMQNSIEIRMPMMDYRLVEFVWGLPQSSKLGNGFTKRILRDAMKGIVPEEILKRRTKIGLAAPTADWFNGSLSQFIMDTVSSEAFLNSPYWKGKKLAKEFKDLTKTKRWTPVLASKAWCYLNADMIIKE